MVYFPTFITPNYPNVDTHTILLSVWVRISRIPGAVITNKTECFFGVHLCQNRQNWGANWRMRWVPQLNGRKSGPVLIRQVCPGFRTSIGRRWACLTVEIKSRCWKWREGHGETGSQHMCFLHVDQSTFLNVYIYIYMPGSIHVKKIQCVPCGNISCQSTLLVHVGFFPDTQWDWRNYTCKNWVGFFLGANVDIVNAPGITRVVGRK